MRTEDDRVPLRIIHIGVGIRGSHWLGFVKEYPDAVTAACVDIRPEALEAVKARFGNDYCPLFPDADAALDAVEADAVLIATPSALHAGHSLKALDKGLTVMTEKPLATTMDDAREVLARAGEVGRPVVVAENYRFAPAERTVRKLVADGSIGKVMSVTVTDRRNQPSRTEGPWLCELEFPQLQEVAIHHFDSFRSWFGCDAESISARTWNPPSDYASGACTQAMIEMEGDIHVSYFGSMTSPRFAFELRIEGDRGELWSNRKYVFQRSRSSRFFRPARLVRVPEGDGGKYPRGGTTSLLNSLKSAVEHGGEAETSGRDNIRTLAMVEAGKVSVRERRTVSIDEVMEP